jgi:hypothetical protein
LLKHIPDSSENETIINLQDKNLLNQMSIKILSDENQVSTLNVVLVLFHNKLTPGTDIIPVKLNKEQ